MPKSVDTRRLKNLRGAPEFAALAELIRERSHGRHVLFVPAAGNWGDGLINVGSRQFLSHHALAHEEVLRRDALAVTTEHAEAGRRVLVIVGGGGAWCKNFSSTRELVERLGVVADHVLVLPTTFELPRSRHDNVTYVARDRFLSSETVPESHFCHDMAFFTDLEVLETVPKLWRLFAMRRDREGMGHADHFDPNVDLSKFGDATYTFVDPFFQMINMFKIVTTDRMHVAIAGSMLGVQVNLVGGNYPKSRDVFRSSLEPNFSNCRFTSIEDVLEWYSPAR